MTYLKHSLFLFVIGLTCSCNEGVPPRVWVTYTAPDRSFSVSMPDGYDTTTVMFDTLPVHYVNWSFSKPYHVVFIKDMDIKRMELNYIELPAAAQQLSVEQLLDTSIFYFASRHDHTFAKDLKKAEDISLGNYRGRAFTIEIESGKAVKKEYFLRKYLVVNRLYTLWVITYKTEERCKQLQRNKQIDQFFDSFRITG